MYIWVAIAFLADVSFADLPNGKCFIANRADPTHGFQNQTAVLDEQNQKMEQEEKKQEQEKQIKDQHQKDFEHEQQQMQFLEDQKQQQKQKQLNNQNIAPIKQKSLDSQKNRDFKPNKDLDTQSCIDAHNEARKSIGLPYLRWNANLASSASNYAAKLESLNYLVHSKGPYGENLYSGTASCTNAVAYWTSIRDNRSFQETFTDMGTTVR